MIDILTSSTPIPYIVVFDGEGENFLTPFQLYSYNTIVLSALTLNIVKSLPASLGETVWTREWTVRQRLNGNSNYVIVPGKLSELAEALPTLPVEAPILLIPDRKICRQVVEVCGDRNVLVTPFDVSPESITSITWRCSRDDVFDYLASFIPSELSEDFHRNRRYPKETIPGAGRIHLTTQPNLYAMASIGLEYERYEGIQVIDDHARLIEESALALKQAITGLGEEQNNIMIVSPGVSWDYYKNPRAIAYKLFPKSRGDREVALDMMRRKGYVQQKPVYEAEDTKAQFDRLAERITNSSVFQLRRMELFASASFCSARAASLLLPTFRLPELHNEVFGPLTALANATDLNPANKSHMHKQRKKVNKCALALSNTLQQEIPAEILRHIVSTKGILSQAGDLPLELIDAGGVPLNMVREMTRIPLIPGDSFVTHAMRSLRTTIDAKSLCSITVIRGLSKTDDLYPLLAGSVRSMLGGAPHLTVRIIDVGDAREFVEQIASINTPLVILDCHGAYDPKTGKAGLRIGKDFVDVGEVLTGVSVPPLVILSACNTHPVHGSHNSAVNGFLMNGAYAVLGTLLPIHGLAAAALIGSILGHIARWCQTGRGVIRWSSLISRALRMQYALEVCATLSKHRWSLDTSAWFEALRHFERALMTGTEWDILRDQIAESAGIDAGQVVEALREETFLIHAAQYVHFGVPENVGIDNDG
ncbi:CHAT domain-containing protein [Ensifer adhaerens]|uniref:CHAT domain-containing protein n=1 Tax=Ensifer adhaerens TaxID=106592 RepID=A0A9Q8YES1_ENSAD|nr:CHAT domain-containing protein [Ensifer adhaerens]USJ27583.1 CHAT domain-containing protein [Ensifer adhaerens]